MTKDNAHHNCSNVGVNFSISCPCEHDLLHVKHLPIHGTLEHLYIFVKQPHHAAQPHFPTPPCHATQPHLPSPYTTMPHSMATPPCTIMPHSMAIALCTTAPLTLSLMQRHCNGIQIHNCQ
ncbi:hypothetical protein E2C01_005499 [Portunus trituberculatus]|uniref:Uncharacterized protein n=1 Tax=Portunus trituberculatus TaxID=210409 RepID=A0A5B7CVA5_PORTR|nr:hypothetical protein [Portunus trituberculatus]